jgi:hypothetical protein
MPEAIHEQHPDASSGFDLTGPRLNMPVVDATETAARTHGGSPLLPALDGRGASPPHP